MSGSGAETTEQAIDNYGTGPEKARETATTDGFESSTKGNLCFTFKISGAFEYRLITPLNTFNVCIDLN